MATLALDSNVATPTAEKKILVIEDDPEWQSLIGNVITKYDGQAKVKYTFSVQGARNLLQSMKYDLIIADHFLEGDDTGLDFWKECQKEHHNTPFMMMSGLTDREFLHLIENEDNYPLYLSKRQMFQPDQLKEMLTWHLGGPTTIKEDLDQRFVLTLLLFAMVPFLGLPVFLSPPVQITAPPTQNETINNIEEKLRRIRTADVDKAIKKIKTSPAKRQEMVTDISSIITPNIKSLMKDILSRATEIIVQARGQSKNIRK